MRTGLHFPATSSKFRIGGMKVSDVEDFLDGTETGRLLVQRRIAREMPYWICTEAGQEWLERAGEETGRPRVLVVMHGDGYVEAFAQGGVSVRFVEVACEKKRAGTKLHSGCEEYARRELPKFWRRVWDTGKLIRTAFFSRLRLSDLVDRELRLLELKAAKDACGE